MLFCFFFLLSAWHKLGIFERSTEGKHPRSERGNKQHVWMLVVSGTRVLIQIVKKGGWGGRYLSGYSPGVASMKN